MSPSVHNLFADLPDASDAELTEELLATPSIRIERIASYGHASPAGSWYDQDYAEWVALLRGRAVLAFDDGEAVELQAGDFLLIPAHCCHRVDRTSGDAIWLAAHVIESDPDASD